MAKPAITKRVTKGSALTYAELDTNFQNLTDATVALTAGTAGTQVTSDLNGNITLVAGTGISLAGNNTAKTITVTNSSPGGNTFATIAVGATNVVADSTTDTLTLTGATGISITADAGTDTITIAGTANFGEIQSGTANRLSYYVSGISGVAANKTLDDALIAYGNTGSEQSLTATNALALNATGAITLSGTGVTNITGNGLVTITPGTNNNISLSTTGTGVVTIGGLGALNAASVSNGGNGVIIDSGSVGITSTTNADVYITPNGTGKLIVVGDVAVGDTAAGAIIHSNWNNTSSFLTLRARNSTTVGELSLENGSSYLKAGGAGTGGVVYIQAVDGNINLQPKTSTGKVVVGAASGTGGSTITSFTTNDLVLNTNSGSSGGSITLGYNTNSNIIITPDGTGSVLAQSDTLVLGALTDPEAVITTDGATDLVLDTNDGTNSGSITIIAGADGDIEITPNGTGETVITNLVATEKIVANGNSGAATLTPNAVLGAVQSYTLTGNITFSAFGTPVAGQSITLILTQDATGSRLLTSTMKFAGGSKTLSTAANAVDIITVYYDGTNYWASLSKGFA